MKSSTDFGFSELSYGTDGYQVVPERGKPLSFLIKCDETAFKGRSL